MVDTRSWIYRKEEGKSKNVEGDGLVFVTKGDARTPTHTAHSTQPTPRAMLDYSIARSPILRALRTLEYDCRIAIIFSH